MRPMGNARSSTAGPLAKRADAPDPLPGSSRGSQLLSCLPEHLADMAAFTLATGLRRANVTGLQWSQVDLVRRLAWIHPDQAKARKAIPVPLKRKP